MTPKRGKKREKGLWQIPTTGKKRWLLGEKCGKSMNRWFFGEAVSLRFEQLWWKGEVSDRKKYRLILEEVAR